MSDYTELINSFGPKKGLGQNFLRNKSIASIESEYSYGKKVIEIGPGLGILTEQLCSNAKEVVAVEKDKNLYEYLKSTLGGKFKNLKLINDDFFKGGYDFKDYDIMISNIPYNLSSKTISWLEVNNKDALLCVQREFANHLLAKPDSNDYSKLSVVSELKFKVDKIMRVSRNNFYPVPKVDSELIYLTNKGIDIDYKDIGIISLLMEHKKKTLRNAIIDSRTKFKIKNKDDDIKSILAYLSDENIDINERVFKIDANRLLEISRTLNHHLA